MKPTAPYKLEPRETPTKQVLAVGEIKKIRNNHVIKMITDDVVIYASSKTKDRAQQIFVSYIKNFDDFLT